MTNLLPKQGEIWRVNFDPTLGSEVQKTRPALVMSADDIGILPLRIVVPITAWSEEYSNRPWMIRLEPNPNNQLTKPSAADVFQIKSISTQRFLNKLGNITYQEFGQLLRALSLCVEPNDQYTPPTAND